MRSDRIILWVTVYSCTDSGKHSVVINEMNFSTATLLGVSDG